MDLCQLIDNVGIEYNLIFRRTNLILQLFNIKKINIFADYEFSGLEI